ncbi:MAG TPA: serine hydrolase domain-containing protein, partial [Thermoanaerobaculia bacterium]|nr:serine hydrolase domain-containing protein [Thermoanaerobaculia bacterium]
PTPAIRDAVAATGTPGLVAVVVDRNGIIYSESFGLRDKERKLPVTSNTRFYIASSTKSFNALAALLTIDIDAPLDETLPKLRLPPPLDPARMSLRDLMTHRLGFSNDPVVVRTSYTGNWDDEWIWSAMQRFTKITPRKYEYDNLGYNLLGYAIAPWQETVAQRVLLPAGLGATTTRVPPAGAEVAVPYTISRDGWLRVEPKTPMQMHAAGGMYSTANDLARWLRIQLGEGTIDGREIFPRRIIRETQSPQIHFKQRFQRFDRFAYGLGWVMADLDGDLVIHHFGGYVGAQAHVSFMPERGLGIAVLTNSDGPFAHAVASYLYDRLRNRPDADAKFAEAVKRAQDAVARAGNSERARLEKAAAKVPPGSDRTVASLAGNWKSDELGTFVISSSGAARIGDLHGRIEPYRGSAFVFRYNGNAELMWLRADGALIWQEVAFRK